MADGFLQRHFANLHHIRAVFRVDPRVGRGSGQIAPWLSGIVGLTHPAFPGSNILGDPTVRGFGVPAVGTDWLVPVSSGERWRIRAINAQLTTDANVANRSVILEFNDTINIFCRIPAVVTQPASVINRYTWVNIGYEKSSIERLQGLPDFTLQQAWTVGPVTSGLQAGDQWTQPIFLIEALPFLR